MRKIKKLNQKGFSLIELMVVVAIIAILSTIAIPAYQSFQIKARQKEAQSSLGAYFIAAQASKVEHGGHAGNFVAIGFNPAGQLKYRITAVDNSTNVQIGTGPNEVACIVTNVTCTGFKPAWTELGGSETNKKVGCEAPKGPLLVAEVTSDAFKVLASGVINPRAGKLVDTWGINEVKTLVNLQDGANEVANADGSL